MSNLNIFGLHSVTKMPGARLRSSLSGLIEFNETRIGREADVQRAYNQLTEGFSNSPDFPGLQLEQKELVFDEGGQSILILQWAGTSSSSGSAQDPLPDPYWELIRTPSQEPIDAHPNFKEEIGGTPSAPLNGAIFDDDGIFVGFPATLNGEQNDYGGLSKYLEANTVLRKSWVSRTEPDGGQIIPRIDTPSISGSRGIGRVPSLGGKRNWLKTDLVYSRRGPVYDIREEWTASGPRGWLDYYKA
jgi:hypothetical protein